MTEEEYEKYIVYRKIIGIITIASWVIVIFLVSFTLLTDAVLKDPIDHDISNWATLVIEIGLAAALGISFLVYQQSGEKTTKEANEKRRINSKKGIAFGLGKLKNHLEDCKKGISQSHSGILSTKPLTGFSDSEKNKIRFVIDQIILYHCVNAHYLPSSNTSAGASVRRASRSNALSRCGASVSISAFASGTSNPARASDKVVMSV